MKLEVGMYVRTCEEGIGKVEICICSMCEQRGYFDPRIIFKNHTEYITGEQEELLYGKKASHNLIDLIEVGDFVNQQEILGFHIMGGNVIALIGVYKQKIVPEHIKEILTKEQYEANVYIVKED